MTHLPNAAANWQLIWDYIIISRGKMNAEIGGTNETHKLLTPHDTRHHIWPWPSDHMTDLVIYTPIFCGK